MDIEGSEPQALLGGVEFFRRNRPVIFAELLGDAAALLAAAQAIRYRHTGTHGDASPMLELSPTDRSYSEVQALPCARAGCRP